jgi:hypothetical protein
MVEVALLGILVAVIKLSDDLRVAQGAGARPCLDALMTAQYWRVLPHSSAQVRPASL